MAVCSDVAVARMVDGVVNECVLQTRMVADVSIATTRDVGSAQSELAKMLVRQAVSYVGNWMAGV